MANPFLIYFHAYQNHDPTPLFLTVFLHIYYYYLFN